MNKRLVMRNKGTRQKRFSGFLEDFFLSGKGGYPPTPLTEKYFAKKPLVERGVIPPPLTESPLSFSGKFFPKRAKNDVFFIK